MKNMLVGLTNWFVVDPRRAAIVLFVIVMMLALTTALVPEGTALAGSITSGS